MNVTEKTRDAAQLGAGWKYMVLITLLAVLLRLIRINHLGLWYDEATGLFLSNYAASAFQLFNADYNSDPPFFLIVLLCWRGFLSCLVDVGTGTPTLDVLLRLVSFTFSVLTVPMTYYAGCILFQSEDAEKKEPHGRDSLSASEKASLFGAFLVALSPFQIFYAHELRNYSLFALLGTATLWVFVRATHSGKRRYWLLLSACLALSFWNHFIGAWFFIVLNLVMLLTWRTNSRHYVAWFFCQVIAMLFCLPPLYLMFQVMHTINQIQVQWIPPPDLKTPFITFKAFFAGYSPRSWAYWPIFILCSGLCGWGAWNLRAHFRALCLLMAWTFVAMLACALIWRYRSFSYYELRLFIWSAISASMLAGWGWIHLPKNARLAIACALLLFTLPTLADLYAHRIHPVPQHRLGVRHKADSRSAALYLKEASLPDEPIYHASHVTLPSFRYYLPSRKHTHVCLDESNVRGFINAYPNELLWSHLDYIPVPMENLPQDAASFWLVHSWWEPFDPPDMVMQIEEWCSSHFREVERRPFFAATLIRYERKDTAGPKAEQ